MGLQIPTDRNYYDPVCSRMVPEDGSHIRGVAVGVATVVQEVEYDVRASRAGFYNTRNVSTIDACIGRFG